LLRDVYATAREGMAMSEQPPHWIVAALSRPEAYPHPVAPIRVMETHISWVFLTGEWAYKVKKPVALGFLDFTTLESRRHFCHEELRLNRRLAPNIYDSVVEIRGNPHAAQIGGNGAVLDYALRMREFPQHALASALILSGDFHGGHIDLLAEHIASFHAHAQRVDPGTPYGTPEAVLQPALQNFDQLLPCIDTPQDRDALLSLGHWTRAKFERLKTTFAERRSHGYVRECHGDLHLRNIAVLNGQPVAFDCIEFDAALRWIDVMNEVAFLVMDLEDFGRPDLAYRFLNRYLETTGDYEGLRLLRFYLVYRAMVRAKIHAMRARQQGLSTAERERLDAAAHAYIVLAAQYKLPGRPALAITCGLSGSGKTSLTQHLIEEARAIRVRSDVERKRLHGLAAHERSGSATDAGIYSEAATAATYERLLALSETLISCGYRTVVDAAFLRRAERTSFRAAAVRLGVPFSIIAFEAPVDTLRNRIVQRYETATDASEADVEVLERQILHREPLATDELPFTIHVDTTGAVGDDLVQRVLREANGGQLMPRPQC
jgi:aminoglycoside phosphotransferase family enzyme/predicted kinase